MFNAILSVTIVVALLGSVALMYGGMALRCYANRKAVTQVTAFEAPEMGLHIIATRMEGSGIVAALGGFGMLLGVALMA